MTRGVLDKHGRPIRPLVWFYHAPEMCDASLERGEWQTGRTECKRMATVEVERQGQRAGICGWHAGRVRRGVCVYVAGFGCLGPDDLPPTE